RESSFLYGGTRLVVAQEWAKTHRDELNALEAEFLADSRRKRRRGIEARIGLILVLMASAIGTWAFFQGLERTRSHQITLAVEDGLSKARKLVDDGHW